ncbi:MAG TPA: hypothetical protein VHS55_05640 [Solirubrobacteraceae bacterium]|jgi:hypothetical protein|nr:hypothetical protein [Solirubrobacteraceae bacterium]
MAYEHDEIVRPIGDGFSIKWDTTRVDKSLEAEVRAFAQERAAELGRIIDGPDDAGQAANGAGNGRMHAAGRRARTAT